MVKGIFIALLAIGVYSFSYAGDVGDIQFSNISMCGKPCILVEYSVESEVPAVESIFVDVSFILGGAPDPDFLRYHIDLVPWGGDFDCGDLSGNSVGSYWVDSGIKVRIDFGECARVEGSTLTVEALIGDFSLSSSIESIELSQAKTTGFGLQIIAGGHRSISRRTTGGTKEQERLDSGQGPVRDLGFLVQAHPNPFNAHVELWAESQRGEIASGAFRIYDVRGRLVYQAATSESGAGSIIWNGRSNAGTSLPSGKYIILFSGYSNGLFGKKSILLLK